MKPGIQDLLTEYEQIEQEEQQLIQKRKEFFWKTMTCLAEVASSATPGELRIRDLDFTQRTFNCLRRGEIHTLTALAITDDRTLKSIRGFGVKCFKEVNDKLVQYGFQPIKETVVSVPSNDRYGDDDE